MALDSIIPQLYKYKHWLKTVQSVILCFYDAERATSGTIEPRRRSAIGMVNIRKTNS